MPGEAEQTNTENSTQTATDQTQADTIETSALGGADSNAAAAAIGSDATNTQADGENADSGKVDANADGEGKGDKGEAGAVPEAYELTAPEGMTLDPADIELATPVFKELGLDNDQANKLMPVAAAFAQRVADNLGVQQLQQVQDWRKETFATAQADPEIGGAKWDESLSFAAKALDTFGAPKGSPFRNALDESGWGNHVEFVRIFQAVGRAVGEDGDLLRGDTGSRTDLPMHDRVYGGPTPAST